jgi:hypothetical protein
MFLTSIHDEQVFKTTLILIHQIVKWLQCKFLEYKCTKHIHMTKSYES